MSAGSVGGLDGDHQPLHICELTGTCRKVETLFGAASIYICSAVVEAWDRAKGIEEKTIKVKQKYAVHFGDDEIHSAFIEP